MNTAEIERRITSLEQQAILQNRFFESVLVLIEELAERIEGDAISKKTETLRSILKGESS